MSFRGCIFIFVILPMLIIKSRTECQFLLGDQTLVTILTVSYNSEKTIGRTIESVLKQTYHPLEYIIIDGASKDGTIKIAESYKLQFEEKGIKYVIVSEPDKGMYDGLNKGAQLAHGEIIGQINSDDWYELDAVETMMKLFEKEKYDAGWGSIRIKKKSGDIIKHARISRFWTTTHWCHPGMFSRREVLIQYPYALESMYDDFDYITAVYRAGKKIVTTDKIVSNFTFGEGGQSTKKGISEAMNRVKITYGIYRKYGMSKLYYLHRCLVEGIKLFAE